MLENAPNIRHFYLESNFATDKKASQINIMRTRGKRVTAECTIPRDVLLQHMRVDPETVHYHANIANVGAFLSGANNNGCHSPNGITAGDSRANSPYFPTTHIANQRNFNADLSYSHALRNNVDSWRISPFYRHAVDKLELTKPYTVNPATGVATLSGTTYFRTGIQNKATGSEFGWNHVVRGDGFSWYLAGTYVNYWGSVTSGALAGGTPYGSITSNTSFLKAFLSTQTLFRNPSQPPWSVSWTGDYRKGRFHGDPFVIYQVGAPYNVVPSTFTDPTTGAVLPDNKVHFAKANWWTAVDLGYDFYKKNGRTMTVGMNIRNLFSQPSVDVVPSTNSNYGKGANPDLNTYGPGSVPNTLYYYAPDATPTQYQLYLRTKF